MTTRSTFAPNRGRGRRGHGSQVGSGVSQGIRAETQCVTGSAWSLLRSDSHADGLVATLLPGA